nr:DUF6462 family protein [uncultured Blautia sp.]
MQKRAMSNENHTEVKAGRIEQACARYGLGKNTMRKVAGEAGAEIKIGKCYLINFSKVDAYMDSLAN